MDLNKEAIIAHAKRYSPAFDGYSPWKTDFEAMAMKTVIKKVLKFAPLKAELQRAIASDETIKNQIAMDMIEINSEEYYDNYEEGDNE